MQQRIGHLSPYAMMDRCGFIMARGREPRGQRVSSDGTSVKILLV
jgi:hypothetical protein